MALAFSRLRNTDTSTTLRAEFVITDDRVDGEFLITLHQLRPEIAVLSPRLNVFEDGLDVLALFVASGHLSLMWDVEGGLMSGDPDDAFWERLANAGLRPATPRREAGAMSTSDGLGTFDTAEGQGRGITR